MNIKLYVLTVMSLKLASEQSGNHHPKSYSSMETSRQGGKSLTSQRRCYYNAVKAANIWYSGRATTEGKHEEQPFSLTATDSVRGQDGETEDGGAFCKYTNRGRKTADMGSIDEITNVHQQENVQINVFNGIFNTEIQLRGQNLLEDQDPVKEFPTVISHSYEGPIKQQQKAGYDALQEPRVQTAQRPHNTGDMITDMHGSLNETATAVTAPTDMFVRNTAKTDNLNETTATDTTTTPTTTDTNIGDMITDMHGSLNETATAVTIQPTQHDEHMFVRNTDNLNETTATDTTTTPTNTDNTVDMITDMHGSLNETATAVTATTTTSTTETTTTTDKTTARKHDKQQNTQQQTQTTTDALKRTLNSQTPSTKPLHRATPLHRAKEQAVEEYEPNTLNAFSTFTSNKQLLMWLIITLLMIGGVFPKQTQVTPAELRDHAWRSVRTQLSSSGSNVCELS
jgi:hypothetical protein